MAETDVPYFRPTAISPAHHHAIAAALESNGVIFDNRVRSDLPSRSACLGISNATDNEPGKTGEQSTIPKMAIGFIGAPIDV